MKYFIAVLCLAQIVLSAPAEKTVVEQAQESLATAKEQATVAVSAANEKLLEVVGAKSNTELLTSLDEQGKTYVKQVKSFVDELSEKTAPTRTQVSDSFTSLLTSLSDLTAEFLSNNDPAQADKLKNTFNNVLTQTNELSTQLKQQGEVAQEALSGTVGKLYEKTVDTAKTITNQLDEQIKKP